MARWNSLLHRLIEADRIRKEGATLKNVAENLRTLAVLTVFFGLEVFLWGSAGHFGKLLAAVMVPWLIFYGYLATSQTSLLFACLVFEIFPALRKSGFFAKTLFEAVVNAVWILAVGRMVFLVVLPLVNQR